MSIGLQMLEPWNKLPAIVVSANYSLIGDLYLRPNHRCLRSMDWDRTEGSEHLSKDSSCWSGLWCLETTLVLATTKQSQEGTQMDLKEQQQPCDQDCRCSNCCDSHKAPVRRCSVVMFQAGKESLHLLFGPEPIQWPAVLVRSVA